MQSVLFKLLHTRWAKCLCKKTYVWEQRPKASLLHTTQFPNTSRDTWAKGLARKAEEQGDWEWRIRWQEQVFNQVFSKPCLLACETPGGRCLVPFWSAGWGGTCGYLECFLIWKFTLSSSTFRLMEAAESLSMADWKLLTEVRLLGLAESFRFGEEGKRDTGRKGVGLNSRYSWGYQGEERNGAN